MDMKRFFLYAIAIAALALAGCGGNGGGSTPAVTPGPGVTLMCDAPQMPNAGGTACVDPTPAGPTADEIAAATKAAATKVTAILASAGETGDADAGIGGSPPAGDSTTYSFTIARDRDGTKVAIADSNADFEEDADPKFETVMDLGEANGFAGTMNLRVNSDDEDGKVEEVTVVRTDIKAPTARPFGVDDDNMGVYMLEDRKDGMTVDEDNPADSLGVDEATDGVSNLPKIMATDFAAPSGEGSTVTHTFLPADEDTDSVMEGDQSRDAAEVMGTYDGAMGTYTCGGDQNCTTTVNAKGEVTGITGDWVFTPATGATVDVEDTSYLAYGIWLKRTTKDGETTYNEVEAFTGGNVPVTDATEVRDVVGSATYMGNSTGVYVKNVTDNTGAIETATSGLYSALVNLTATFGGNNVGVNNKFRIEGTVTNFALQQGEENDWAVKLESADFGGRDNNTVAVTPSTPTNVFNSTTVGDSTVAKGVWNGGFYGATPLTTADTDPGTDRVAPPHVLGEFNANFTDGAVLGGFGANK